MVDYTALKNNVMDISSKVSEYSSGQIKAILNTKTGLETDTLKNWVRLTQEICYDRTYCKLLGVDYEKLPDEDREKIKVFALLLVKEDPDIILPYLSDVDDLLIPAVR